MDLTTYVDLVRRELATAAEVGGADARDLAERLTAPLESAMRLTLLEALSAAAAEITRDLAPGSVHVRLSGRDLDFVVTPAEGARQAEPEPSTTAPAFDDVPGSAGGSSRINLRLPDDVKVRVEEAASRERISINAWLVRAAVGALDPARTPTSGHRAANSPQRYTGWAQ